jgi:hypothetical protein
MNGETGPGIFSYNEGMVTMDEEHKRRFGEDRDAYALHEAVPKNW